LKCLSGVLLISTLGIALAIVDPAYGQTPEEMYVVHPAPASKMITVTVTELRRFKHGKDKEVLIAQGAGFPNDTCDVITTFDVVKTYEERETWAEVRQKIDIVIDGKPYPAELRDFGFYPLGLNLACIDFVSPSLRTQLQIPVLPLELDSRESSSLKYDETEIAKSDAGTPFLNERGEISSVLIATQYGALKFATADEIRWFLSAAAATPSPWPKLRRRSLS
jgi:hypothetical protein